MKKFIIFLILIISLIFLYGKYIEPNNFKIKEYSVIDTNIPESFNGYKIIHLTDLYYENKDLILFLILIKGNSKFCLIV